MATNGQIAYQNYSAQNSSATSWTSLSDHEKTCWEAAANGVVNRIFEVVSDNFTELKRSYTGHF